MQDILLSQKQYFSLLKRLDEINADVTSIKLKTVPGVGFIDTYDLMMLLHVSIRTVQRWRKSGRLPYTILGQKVYYKADVILDSFKMFPGNAVEGGGLANPVEGMDSGNPVEVEYPPPEIKNLKIGSDIITCKKCPLFLLLIS